MPYVSEEKLTEARSVDLLSWMQANEPGNLVRISGNNYCTKEHDSLKISNGKWYWFSRGIGGVSALDYLIKVKEYTLPQAVEAITGTDTADRSFFIAHEQEKPRVLLMPDVVKHPDRAVRYLTQRGIHPEVIAYCISNSMLFETEKYHNVVFVGYDSRGIARYGAMRGTMSPYKGEVTGSDKHFSFAISDSSESGHLHLFESAIDLLSYASLERLEGRDWKRDKLLSLAGVFMQKREKVVPVALKQYLEDHPGINTIHLHLDNDEVGRGASRGILEGLAGNYTVLDEPPESGKDMNDTLLAKIRQNKRRKEVPER